jgi:hypothetical protein
MGSEFVDEWVWVWDWDWIWIWDWDRWVRVSEFTQETSEIKKKKWMQRFVLLRREKKIGKRIRAESTVSVSKFVVVFERLRVFLASLLYLPNGRRRQ